MAYNKTIWNDKTAPAINANNLNNIEEGIYSAHKNIEQIVGQQIPEEYLQKAVDDYVAENESGLATKTDIADLDNQLSSEIVEVESDIKGTLSNYDEKLFDHTNDYNMFNPNDVIDNSTISTTDGRIVTGENYSTTVVSEIDVSKFEYIRIQGARAERLGFYDENGFILALTGNNAPYNQWVNLTQSERKATYIRMTIKKEPNEPYDYNLFMVYGGQTAEDERKKYVPYNNVTLIIPEEVETRFESLEGKVYDEWVNGLRQCAWRGCMNIVENGKIVAYAPENSFPAFRKGIADGMDYMWLAGIAYTAPESADCDLYIMHDANLLRTTGVDGEIRNMTSAEIDAIPLLTRGTTEWSADDLRIPRFEDCIKLALRNKQKMGLRIGIPAPNNTTNRQLLWNKFFAYCDKYNLADAIYSGDIEHARVVTAHNPMLHVQTTGSSSDTVEVVLSALELLHTEGFKNCSHIVYHDVLASNGETIMAKAREYGIKIFAVNLESTNEAYFEMYEQYKKLYTDLCVDGIITHHKIDMNF